MEDYLLGRIAYRFREESLKTLKVKNAENVLFVQPHVSVDRCHPFADPRQSRALVGGSWVKRKF